VSRKSNKLIIHLKGERSNFSQQKNCLTQKFEDKYFLPKFENATKYFEISAVPPPKKTKKQHISSKFLQTDDRRNTRGILLLNYNLLGINCV